jgi:hypothetical protein
MLILTVVASVAILLAAALIPRTQRPEAQFTLAITLSVMVSYYLFIHDLSILLIPIVLRLDRVWANEQAPDPLSIAIAWMAALLLVAPMCIFVMPDHFYLLSLPIFTFMLMLIWNSRHEPSLADTAPP